MGRGGYPLKSDLLLIYIIMEEKPLSMQVAALEEKIRVLEEVIIALCKWKQDKISTVIDIYGWESGMRNEFQHEMRFIDFDYDNEQM